MKTRRYSLPQVLGIILFKTYAEIRVEAARGYIGVFWWLIEPILYLAAFYFVFSVLIDRGGIEFVQFLLCGLIAWKWFDSSVRQGSMSIQNSISLIRQINIPKYIFPAVSLCVNTLKFSVILILLLLFLVIIQTFPSPHWIALPAVILTQFLLQAAVVMVLAALAPLAPDLSLIINNGLILLMILSGVFFEISSMPAQVTSLLNLNPVAVILESYRRVLLFDQWPDFYVLGLISLGAMVAILVGMTLMRIFGYLYPKSSFV